MASMCKAEGSVPRGEQRGRRGRKRKYDNDAERKKAAAERVKRRREEKRSKQQAAQKRSPAEECALVPFEAAGEGSGHAVVPFRFDGDDIECDFDDSLASDGLADDL